MFIQCAYIVLFVDPPSTPRNLKHLTPAYFQNIFIKCTLSFNSNDQASHSPVISKMIWVNVLILTLKRVINPLTTMLKTLIENNNLIHRSVALRHICRGPGVKAKNSTCATLVSIVPLITSELYCIVTFSWLWSVLMICLTPLD